MDVSLLANQEQETEVLESAKISSADVAIYELIDRSPSGMIKDGTERLPEPDELDAPSYRKVLIKSAYLKKREEGKGANKKIVATRVPIHYRWPSEEIHEDALKEADLLYDEDGRPKVDNDNGHIIFKNGRLIVVREGATIGLFDFMKKDSYNLSNPDRIETTTAVYREIHPEVEKEEDNDIVFQKAAAAAYISELVLDRTGGKYVYDEHRLNSLATLFNVTADTPGGKIKGLLANADLDPERFLTTAKVFEEQGKIELVHGEQLGVLRFDNSKAILVPRNKVLVTFPPSLGKDQQYRLLASHFQSSKGSGDYTLFQAEVELVKRKMLSNENTGGGSQGETGENQP